MAAKMTRRIVTTTMTQLPASRFGARTSGLPPECAAREPFANTARCWRLIVTALVAMLAILPDSAGAQGFPERPITLIVAYPPGGSTDVAMRAFAEAASKVFGRRVVVENRPGATGTLAATYVARNVKPDGYTVAQFPTTVLRVPHMQKGQFDPFADLTWIIGTTGYAYGVVVRGDAPWKTWAEFIAHARMHPGKVTYGTSGTGSTLHITMEDLAEREGVKWLHVPYKGNPDAIAALMGGHIDAMASSPGWAEMIDSGKLRLLCVWGETRMKRWPNVPTLKELGYGIVRTSPYGIGGPKGMDPKVVRILHDGFRKAMEDPAYVQVLTRLELENWYRSSDDYVAWAKEQYVVEKGVVERFGLKP